MTPAPPSPRRRTGVVAAGSTAGLGIAAAAVFGVQAATSTTTVVGHASPAQSASAPAYYVPDFGRGDRPYGSGTSNGSASAATASTASPAQQVGVVEINTVLQYQNAQAAGTGMVLTSGGEILTNNHVIDGATSISVTIASTGATYTARVVGTDPTADVAVLQLDQASALQTAKLSTAAPTVGEAVTGVGNAGGTATLTAVTGTVTALNRSITATDQNGANAEQLTGLIEINAAVQAGDSGGPLYAGGKVIGMDTAASSGGPADAYAIPITTATAIAAQIESGTNNATIHQGYPAFLGVSMTDGAGGATVADVVPGSGAEKAGLIPGDVITAVGGNLIPSAADLSSMLRGYRPGDRVSLSWTTVTGIAASATITLGSGPAD